MLLFLGFYSYMSTAIKSMFSEYLQMTPLLLPLLPLKDSTNAAMAGTQILTVHGTLAYTTCSQIRYMIVFNLYFLFNVQFVFFYNQLLIHVTWQLIID